METLVFLVSWVAIVIAIVTLNNKVKKEKGEITFDESSQSYSYANDIRGTRLFD